MRFCKSNDASLSRGTSFFSLFQTGTDPQPYCGYSQNRYCPNGPLTLLLQSVYSIPKAKARQQVRTEHTSGTGCRNCVECRTRVCRLRSVSRYEPLLMPLSQRSMIHTASLLSRNSKSLDIPSPLWITPSRELELFSGKVETLRSRFAWTDRIRFAGTRTLERGKSEGYLAIIIRSSTPNHSILRLSGCRNMIRDSHHVRYHKHVATLPYIGTNRYNRTISQETR